MSITDVAAWVGTYPFRGIRNSSLDDLQAKAAELSIDRFVVASFESLFQENHLDAYERWHETLAGIDCVEHWPVVDPAMPKQLRNFERIVDRYQPRGFRLLPNYHGYSLLDGAVDDLMTFAQERGLVAQVFAMIADYRWHYMLKMPAVSADLFDHFTGMHPDAKIIISGQQPVQRMAARAKQCPNLYLDISRVRGPVMAMEKLVNEMPTQKLLFGSLWPIQIIEGTLWHVTWTKLPAETQAAILGGNFETLMGG
jgi:predicted TIM-barrel fold metal-dependent hydrolase